MLIEEKIIDQKYVFDAMKFAMRVHNNQKRKYTNVPYFTHLAEVAGILSTIRTDPFSLSIAWLHDCIEDCGVEYTTLVHEFGEGVACGVLMLSDLEEGNREYRKIMSRERLSKSPSWIQDIKVCDIISNTSSIIIHDPNFSVLYLEENRLLLDVLDKANNELKEIARSFIYG